MPSYFTSSTLTKPKTTKRDPLVLEGDINQRHSLWMDERAAHDWKPRYVDWYQREAEGGIARLEDEAKRIQGEEERRGARAEDLLRGEWEKASVPTITDETQRRLMSKESDAAGSDLLGRMRDLNAYVGAAGWTGGGAPAALAANFELARAGQLTNSRRALEIERAYSDMQDRVRRFQGAQVVAQVGMRQPSTAYSDFLSSSIDTRLSQTGVERGYMAAEKSAKASEKAGQLGAFGSIVGGIGGLVGGLL